jgi:hypothetical protein
LVNPADRDALDWRQQAPGNAVGQGACRPDDHQSHQGKAEGRKRAANRPHTTSAAMGWLTPAFAASRSHALDYRLCRTGFP